MAAWCRPPYGGGHADTERREDDVNMRRSRVLSFPVAEDGTVDLPEGAVIISLEFESEGSYGYKSRPVTAWAEVPADGAG
jgi:hypothetical protein